MIRLARAWDQPAPDQPAPDIICAPAVLPPSSAVQGSVPTRLGPDACESRDSSTCRFPIDHEHRGKSVTDFKTSGPWPKTHGRKVDSSEIPCTHLLGVFTPRLCRLQFLTQLERNKDSIPHPIHRITSSTQNEPARAESKEEHQAAARDATMLRKPCSSAPRIESMTSPSLRQAVARRPGKKRRHE